MKTLEACKRDVAVARRDTTLTEAARLMRERHVGCVVVIEAEGVPRPVGILTDRDIVVEVVAAGLDPRVLTVGEVMSAPLVNARADDDAGDTLKAMNVRGIRRMPVVDESGWLVGIATVDDLLEMAGEALNDVVGAIRGGRSLEGWTRR